MSRSPIEQLLISPPWQPDDPAWSPQAHAVDDLMRRAAYYGLMYFFSRTEAQRERDEAQRQACIDGAKRIAGDRGWRDYNVELHVSTCERITERAYKKWCEVHSDEIMQRYYARNPEAARRLLTGDDDDET
jgi:hypothetical protein